MIKSGRLILLSYLMVLMSVTGLSAQDLRQAGPAGTKIIFQTDKNIIPCKWRNKKTRPEYSFIRADDIPHTLEILNTSLGKYPPLVLKKNLKRIYVLKKLYFFGLEYGGTYYKKEIFLTNNGKESGYTDQYIEGTFHHEFSSVLIKRYGRFLNTEGWLEANPDGFSYGDGGVEALRKNTTGLKLDTALFDKGFLNEYSLSSFEEDLNCYAEYIFRNDPGFWQAWELSEAIRRKTAILISFYHRIDPVFSQEYFKRL
ncbi:MAG: hypothetical protein DRJ15_04775 [Bacteroidetes bacterium]|nr:MAG: hypothetical protein DRJ15_04775 [Bacteroidota bacterium]